MTAALRPVVEETDPAKALLRKIRRIEIRTTRLVNEALAGEYHSAFKGVGMAFEEVRPYAPGDDVRRIDWNVSARFGEPFIKVFREERELTVVLLVDLSGSQGFGSGPQLKRDVVAELGATLAFSAIKNNDKVGLFCFTDRIEKVVPPRKGTRHVLRVVRELLTREPQHRGTDIAEAATEAGRLLRRRSVIFLISDFQDRDYVPALARLRRRHDLILVDVSDPREQALPAVGLLCVQDRETGQRMLVDTSSRRWRRRFAEETAWRRDERRRSLLKAGLDAVEIDVGRSFVEPLVTFFRAREKRRR